MNAVKKAKEAGFFDFDDFDCEGYEHYEKVQIFPINYQNIINVYLLCFILVGSWWKGTFSLRRKSLKIWGLLFSRGVFSSDGGGTLPQN